MAVNDELPETKSIDKKKEKKKISWSFAYYNLGIFLCWSAYVAIFNLQSSINVEDGLGTTTLAAMFFSSVFFGTFGAPVALRKFGTKACILVGDASMFPFILANLYPRYYTLLPAGILMATLQSPLWPSMSVMNVLYASRFTYVSKRAKDVHIISFSGRFFTVFQASQVFGSLVSYIILYGFDQIPVPEVEILTNCTNMTNVTCQAIKLDYIHCGVNDCQNATIISEKIEQYKPANSVSLYVLVGVTIFLELLGLLVHAFLLPNDKKFERKIEEYKMALLPNQNRDIASLREDGNEPLKASCEVSNATEIGAVDDEGANDNIQEEKGLIILGWENAKSVFKHSLNVKLLLLIPITLYNGLTMSFVETELTRSFSSCILGVQWVGICMAIYGVSDSVLSWAVGRFGRKIGRISIFLIALVLECGIYLYCLVWSPGPNLLFSILAIFFAFGITDGIFQTIVNVTHIDFFSTNQGVAIPMWNVIVECGLALGYALSTVFCVKTRIYFNISFVIAGCIGVVIADWFHRRSVSKANLVSLEDSPESDAKDGMKDHSALTTNTA